MKLATFLTLVSTLACGALLANCRPSSSSTFKHELDLLLGSKSVFAQLFGGKLVESPHNSSLSALNANLDTLPITRKAYQKYLHLFNKSYKDAAELERRFKVFASRAKEIIKSKIDYLTGKSTFSLAINQFADWHDEELASRSQSVEPFAHAQGNSSFIDTLLEKLRKYLNEHNDYSQPDIIANGTDLRTTGCVTAVRAQGNCGSCYAFAATAALETSACMNDELNPGGSSAQHLSTQHLVDCFVTRHSGQTRGCNGGNVHEAAQFLARLETAVSDACYPYIARQQECRLSDIKRDSCFVPLATNDKRFMSVLFVGEKAMIEHLDSSGPLIAGVYLNRDFMFYGRGVLQDKGAPRSIEDLHALVIVGYGTDEDGTQFWLAKNSFGASWGEGGYVKVQRSRNAYNIEADASGLNFIDKQTIEYLEKEESQHL